jgi:glycosyltransferase involved in cell wall biosynthesis
MNSIHIRRWAGWFRPRGHFVGIVSLTKENGSSSDYDEFHYVPPKSGFLAYARRSLPIAKAVRQFKPDIVHGHFLTGGGFYAVASQNSSSNVVVSAWGSDIYMDCHNFLKRKAIMYALKHSKVVMGDSDHILKEVLKLSPKSRTEKVIFGVDTEKFKPNPVKHDKFRFLSIRTTGDPYNPMIIVKAFQAANLDAELWMFKPSACSFDVLDFVKSDPELDKKVVWLDRMPHDKMPELYNQVDVGISIPYWDSSSTAVSESMASGVPVLASYIEQEREWIIDDDSPNSNGFFWDDDYDSAMEDSLAKDMRRVFETPNDERIARGLRGREKIKKDADWNTQMLRAESIYNEVLNGKA